MDQYNNNYTNGPERDPFAPGSYQPGPAYQPPQRDFEPDPMYTEPQKPKKTKKKKGWVKFVALGLVCALVGAAAMPVYEMVTHNDATTLYVGDRKPTEVNVTSVNTEKEMTTAEIYAAFVGSSVGITVDIVSTNIFGQTVTNAAAGSGFVITEDGYILTNYHVIEGASAITVAFVDGKTYPATFIGGEEANDIAVIKIDAQGLTPVVIGKSGDMLVGELEVGRVIARPFVGEKAGAFTRTGGRRDYSAVPPTTMLELLERAGKTVYAVGKIEDIFCLRGITKSNHAAGNPACMEAAYAAMQEDFDGLLFVNLVDFDMVYGHRRDVCGYAAALEAFDREIPRIKAMMGEEDLLILTADHGCDPCHTGTDHTREHVPLLIYGKDVKAVNLGVRETYADIAATVLEFFGAENTVKGTSVLDKIM